MINNEITTANVKISRGEFSLEADCNPVLLDITYKGRALIESSLPNGFFITEKSRRIIVIRFSHQTMPEKIFNYQGELDVQKVVVYNKSGRSILASLEKQSHKMKDITQTLEQMNSKFMD